MVAGGTTWAAQSVTLCVSRSYDEIRHTDALKSSVSSRANIDIASGVSAADASARVDSITAMRSSKRRELSAPLRMAAVNIDNSREPLYTRWSDYLARPCGRARRRLRGVAGGSDGPSP